MKNRILFRILPFATLAMSSCSLPPREAWRVIQTEGLIPYIAVEMGKKPVPPYVVKRATPNRLLPASMVADKSNGSVSGKAALTSILPTRYLETSSGSANQPSRSLDSPTPVSASRAVTGSNQAPATPRQSLTIPTSIPTRTAQAKVQDDPKGAAPQGPPAPKLTETAAAQSAALDMKRAPVVAAAPKPSAPASPKISTAPMDSSTTPPVATSPQNLPESTPYGVPVPGRPGLVSSPYAGQYQLVDVTGLSAGQEVKCPYSGKIFKVPAPQQQALNKAVIPTAPPTQEPKVNTKP